MSNQIKILYNDIDLFSGIGPIPFVSSSQDFINFNTGWNQVTNLILEGSLTGKYIGNYSNQYLNESFQILIERLSKNYGSLVIKEDSQILLSGQSATIESISIPESNWYGVLPYSINIIIYETGLFKNYYGILEPTENLSFVEEEDQIVKLVHSISAIGLKIDNADPIENAKNWVKSRTGNYNKIIPILSKINGSNFLLESVTENINRFDGSYFWEGNYIKSVSSESPLNSILNYSTNISSGINDGFINVSIEGSLEKNNITSLRSDYSGINFYNLANTLAKNTFNVILNSKPISKSVIEYENENKLEFNILYNNDFYPDVVIDYTVSIEEDSVNLFNNVNLQSTIRSRYGDITSRWQKVQNFYKNNFSPYDLALKEYLKEVSNRILYRSTVSESITFNEYNAEINYVATWSDKRRPFSDDILSMTSSVSFSPSVYIHVPNTSAFLSREHNIQNLRAAPRSVLNINISARAKPDKNINPAKLEVEKEIARILKNYNVRGEELREKRSETINQENKIFTVNEIWSFQGGLVS
jgi:hypothetical protein